MLDGLQAEIDAHPELTGAAKRIIVERLNSPGTAQVDDWILNPSPVLMSINDVYTSYVSNESLERLVDFLELPDQKAMKLRFEKATHFNLSSPVVRGMLDGLKNAGVVTDTEYTALKRAGEVLKSRSEELFGRKITLEDF